MILESSISIRNQYRQATKTLVQKYEKTMTMKDKKITTLKEKYNATKVKLVEQSIVTEHLNDELIQLDSFIDKAWDEYHAHMEIKNIEIEDVTKKLQEENKSIKSMSVYMLQMTTQIHDLTTPLRIENSKDRIVTMPSNPSSHTQGSSWMY